MTEENDLIKRFEGIFIAHYPAVKGFIAALLKSEAYAEDLAQDIFARLWTRHDIWAERDGGHSGYLRDGAQRRPGLHQEKAKNQPTRRGLPPGSP